MTETEILTRTGAVLFWLVLLGMFALGVLTGGLSDPCDKLPTGSEKERCEVSVYYP